MNIEIKNTSKAIEDAKVIMSCANTFESLISTLGSIKTNFETNWDDSTGQSEDRNSILKSLDESINYYNDKIIPALSKLGNGVSAYAIATEQISNMVVGATGASVTPTAYSDYMKAQRLAKGPDFSNKEAWLTENIYAQNHSTENGVKNYIGQCTWFAWGRFYETYGYDPGFSGNGKDCVAQLLNAHPDKFTASTEPVAGAIFSTVPVNSSDPGHVGFVLSVDGDTITIQDGNYDGYTNSFEVAQNDWKTRTMTRQEFEKAYGSMAHFANPIEPPTIGDIDSPFVEKDNGLAHM